MPRRRGTKSYSEIENQANRLINRAEGSYNFSRIDRIGDIRQRYRSNISRSMGGRNLTTLGDIAARNTQVNRRVYMGLATG